MHVPLSTNTLNGVIAVVLLPGKARNSFCTQNSPGPSAKPPKSSATRWARDVVSISEEVTEFRGDIARTWQVANDKAKDSMGVSVAVSLPRSGANGGHERIP